MDSVPWAYEPLCPPKPYANPQHVFKGLELPYRMTDSEIEPPDLLLLHVENFPPFPITITLVTILLVDF